MAEANGRKNSPKSFKPNIYIKQHTSTGNLFLPKNTLGRLKYNSSRFYATNFHVAAQS